MTDRQPVVFLQIDENPNCPAFDGQVFQPKTPARPIVQVRLERNGSVEWWDITGLDEHTPSPAMACLIDDSGDGACLLVFGGSWGLRFKKPFTGSWDLNDHSQWGSGLLLLARDGSDVL